MSSIFSDPLFRRGSTLLGGEKIDLDASGNPIAGKNVVGSVKVFQDVEPTGEGKRLSEKQVYCIAVRYTGATVTDASTVAGQRYNLDAAQEVISAKRTKANADAFAVSGVLDEYLKGQLRQNDIVWVAVKGPVNAVVTGAVSAGNNIAQSATAGSTAVAGGSNSTTVDGTALADKVGTTARVNLHCNFI
jgi:hypothetical protein